MNREPASIRERIRNRRPQREQVPMRGRELFAYFTLAAMIALPAVFLLWQQSECVRESFRIEALRRERLSLLERYRQLRIERATLESLTRISREADRSGLVPPDESIPRTWISAPRGPRAVPGAETTVTARSGAASASPPGPAALTAEARP